MNMHKSSANTETHKPSRREMKEKRIDDLLDSCRDQVLQRIIGPFGLTPTMFNDKDGGSVTTLHNFTKKDEPVFATDEDRQRHEQFIKNVESPIDRLAYDKDFPSKRKEMFKSEEKIISAHTGNELPRDGRMHLDHETPVEKIERDPRANLYMNKEERVAMANAPENLVPSESNINQSMGAKDKEVWANSQSKKDLSKNNAEHFGVDTDRVRHFKDISENHIDAELLKAQVIKQGAELLGTGAEAACKNALRQATGILLHELVSGSFVEIRRLTKEPSLKEEFVDHLIQAIKNVATRIQGKLKKIFESVVSGGVQGFISNLLTYLINCIWTTSAKIVTAIREGMKGLWQAIKLMVKPPVGMSSIEVARQVTKIILSVVTTSLGLVFEESVKTFILSIPLLAPFADTIAPALTAIITGIVTALVIYGIDRMFDWLNASGTEMLEAQMANLKASAEVFEKMGQMLDVQFRNSANYQLCIKQYAEIEANLVSSAASLDWAIYYTDQSISSLTATIKNCDDQFPVFKQMDKELYELLDNYQFDNKGITNV